jgi:hypothetical protein
MYLDVTRIVDEPDGDHEIHLVIVTEGSRPMPAVYTVTDYTMRRFDALYRKSRKLHGRALALLKREGKTPTDGV